MKTPPDSGQTVPVDPHKDPEQCPSCNADLRGEPIPEDQRELFGGNTYFLRTILVTPWRYDTGLYWQCPDCSFAWNRWPKDHRWHKVAEKEMQAAVSRKPL